MRCRSLLQVRSCSICRLLPRLIVSLLQYSHPPSKTSTPPLSKDPPAPSKYHPCPPFKILPTLRNITPPPFQSQHGVSRKKKEWCTSPVAYVLINGGPRTRATIEVLWCTPFWRRSFWNDGGSLIAFLSIPDEAPSVRRRFEKTGKHCCYRTPKFRLAGDTETRRASN